MAITRASKSLYLFNYSKESLFSKINYTQTLVQAGAATAGAASVIDYRVPPNINAIFKINDACFFTDNTQQVFLINANTLSVSPVNFITKDKDLLNLNTGVSQLYWQTGMMNPIIIKANNACNEVCNNIALQII